jgi:hypothetical protein
MIFLVQIEMAMRSFSFIVATRPAMIRSLRRSCLLVGDDFNFFDVAGHLQISNGGTVSAAATTILETGTLAIGGSFTLNGPLTINGGTVRAVADATVPNNATLDTGGAIFDSNGFNLTLSGTLSGPGRITKINQGTLLLMGTNRLRYFAVNAWT